MLRTRITRADVTRTVFEDVERAAELGALPQGGSVRLPNGSIATVTFAME